MARSPYIFLLQKVLEKFSHRVIQIVHHLPSAFMALEEVELQVFGLI